MSSQLFRYGLKSLRITDDYVVTLCISTYSGTIVIYSAEVSRLSSQRSNRTKIEGMRQRIRCVSIGGNVSAATKQEAV